MKFAVASSRHARFARPGEFSKAAACAEYHIHWDTLTKILTQTEPPGYRLAKKRSSKLEPFLAVTSADAIRLIRRTQ